MVLEDGTNIDDDALSYLPPLTILVCHAIDGDDAQPDLAVASTSSVAVPSDEVHQTAMVDLPNPHSEVAAGDQQPVTNVCPAEGEIVSVVCYLPNNNSSSLMVIIILDIQ